MKDKLSILLRLARSQWRTYLAAAGCLVVATLLLYAQPAIVGVTVDSVLGAESQKTRFGQIVLTSLGGADFLREHLWIAMVGVIGMTSLAGVLTFGKMRLGALAAERIVRGLRERLYDHLQRLPLAFHDKNQTGDLVQRCSSDVETTRLFYTDQMLEVARASVLLVTAIPLMFMLDAVMAGVAIALLPVIVLFAIFFFAKVAGTFKRMDEAEGALTTSIQENLTGIRVVRAFARQPFELEKFRTKNEDHRKKHWTLFQVMAVYWASSDFLCFSQLTLTLLVGAYRVHDGSMSAGTLVAFMGYVGIYLWPVRHMGRIVTEMGKTTVAIGRIHEVLGSPIEEPTTKASHEVTQLQLQGEIEFRDVSFKHGESQVLSEISFRAPVGSTVALLGPSGSGKSTIAQLLMRFYEPSSGAILIGGQPIAEMSRKRVRGAIAAVLQEPFLFSRSLRENIKLGRSEALDDEMLDAARTAAIDESVQRFEKRYDTIIGERGVTLSGGQRQRVAIARALLRDAPILILDDALSAVDTHTEDTILRALESRRGRHTTILIAHRLSTLRHAELILVLERGRIVQRGTHDELLSVDGMYRRLWQIQSALEDDIAQEQEVGSVGPTTIEGRS